MKQVLCRLTGGEAGQDGMTVAKLIFKTGITEQTLSSGGPLDGA